MENQQKKERQLTEIIIDGRSKTLSMCPFGIIYEKKRILFNSCNLNKYCTRIVNNWNSLRKRMN